MTVTCENIRAKARAWKSFHPQPNRKSRAFVYATLIINYEYTERAGMIQTGLNREDGYHG